MSDTIQWLLNTGNPWTRYRTFIDLMGYSDKDQIVKESRADLISHPEVVNLIQHASSWDSYTLKRHNDAGHPMYALSTLAEFGLHVDDKAMTSILETVLARQTPEGPFQSKIHISRSFGGDDSGHWGWMACDAPTLLYSLVSMGTPRDARIDQAINHLLNQVEENGWRCSSSPVFGKFRGPGRKGDPCPIANVYALKALSLFPSLHEHPSVRNGIEMLLWHWEHQKERKLYLFGVGTDFRKLKYPFIWYDILHVVDVLSRFLSVHQDLRFQEMLAAITTQADDLGRYTAKSMYRAWKGWSFADKKHPSPWLTFLVLRIQKRITPASAKYATQNASHPVDGNC